MTGLFKEGDVVRLKSGGPDMTVLNPGDRLANTGVVCIWFSNNVKMDDEFPEETLEKVPPTRPVSKIRRA